jgi:ATP-binding cassette, subfamily B, bacterial
VRPHPRSSGSPSGAPFGIRLLGALAIAVRAAPGVTGGFLLLSLAAGGIPVGLALATRRLLNALVAPPSATSGGLMLPALALGALGVASVAGQHVGRYLRADMDRRTAVFANDRLYAAVGRMQGLSRVEDPTFLNRLRLAAQAGQMLGSQIVTGIVDAARTLVTGTGFVATLAVLNLVLVVIVLAAVLLALPAQLEVNRRRAAAYLRTGTAQRRQQFYVGLLTSLAAAKEVRLFGLGQFFHERMLRELRTVNDEFRRVDRRELWVQGVLGVLGAAVAAAGIVWTTSQARGGRLSVGDVSVFVAAIAGIEAAAVGLVQSVGGLNQALLMFGHYGDIARAGPDLAVRGPLRPVPPLRHGIELRDLWFRYGDDQPWILRGVNLVLPYGHAVALVGPNGAGKTTLVKLLCRFYDPTRGAVLWDGVDLRDLPVDELRRRIGAVFQDYMAYDLTAAENIGLGDLTAMGDRERIREAARHAGADGLVSGLPDGYDTLLSRVFFGDRDGREQKSGITLSGGQWQRLALARAFLRAERDLLILDEPSSGLDAEAEHDVHTRLRRYREGRTSLLISHRLGAVRDADEIAVLSDGCLVERGGHADLVRAGGLYARLFSLQANGYQEAGRA